MALYKYPGNFTIAYDMKFDIEMPPGTPVECPGIYKCVFCGDEITANKGDPLPPQNRHQHKNPLLPIRWKLVAAAQQVA